MQRRLEIEHQESALKAQLADLLVEKAQVNRAAIAAGFDAKPTSGSEVKKRGPKPRHGTIKEAVVEILTAQGRGMVAIDLLADLNHRNGSTLLRSSLSPQLSRLKDEGIIQLTDGYWHLPGQPPFITEAPDNPESLFGRHIQPIPQNIGASDPQTFTSKGSKAPEPVPEAQDGKAPSGGGG